MTKQTWTATVSAVLFVVLAVVIALVPVPFVTWSPGGTHDLLGQVDGKDAITISGATVYPTNGQLRMTTVAVTAPSSSLSLPEIVFSYWLPNREVLERDVVYRQGVSSEQVTTEESAQMSDSQSTAVVAALRAAGIDVTEYPMVQSVLSSGPADGILKPGDLIESIDNVRTRTVQEVRDAIRDHMVGDAVQFTLFRGDSPRQRISVTTRANADTPKEPMVGINLTLGYRYAPKVQFAIDPAIGGSSAGLMFALAIYDKVTTPDLVTGRTIAGTGTLSAAGEVGAIGGVQEKLAAAARDGATVFLMPKANCADLSTAVPSTVQVSAVSTLAEAISTLQSQPNAADVGKVTGCS